MLARLSTLFVPAFVTVSTFVCLPAFAHVESVTLKDSTLIVDTNTYDFSVSAVADNSFAITLLTDENGEAYDNLPSMALVNQGEFSPTLEETSTEVSLSIGKSSVVIDKDSHALSYFYDGELRVAERNGLTASAEKVSLSLALDESEMLYGGGQRVLGMDRRGHTMPLYNKAHYGYTTSSNQMYFGLSAVMSSKHYSVLFDNSASGELDMGNTNPDELRFSAEGGRASYIVVLGESLKDTVTSTVAVTGKQPLVPRWLFGNFASRFGYKSQQEVADVVSAFNAQDIPLDAVVLDLYWFGKDVKGHMGNLNWDKEAFPNPEKMISSLKQQDIKTVLITEPFILTTSSQWESAVANNALAQKDDGSPYTFDFYFGNTGLVDVFSDEGQQWFWQYYKKLAAQGVAGWWGDLGEPEVHPDDSIHLWHSKKIKGQVLHNGYGHQWAKMVYSNLRELQPDTRPFVLMRSGFLGSQRFGMVPWTGDVIRSWGGLKPQVELALQMSMFGLAYTHSDLGGFAGGEAFDPELYTRWLQFGAFSPVFRQHAQDAIAPEPVFHDDPVKSIAREFIKLRYAMLPYNYSLAFENALHGTPLMRPLAFDYNQKTWFENAQSYMWGDALLVSVVTEPNQSSWDVALPEGVWFDFFSDTRFEGGKVVQYPLQDNTFPVWVKAGSFMPMSNELARTEDYNPAELTVHYWADNSVSHASYTLYEDDGVSPDSVKYGLYTAMTFTAEHAEQLSLHIDSAGSYMGMPQRRKLTMVVHGQSTRPTQVLVNGAPSDFTWDEKGKRLSLAISCDYQQSVEIKIM